MAGANDEDLGMAEGLDSLPGLFQRDEDGYSHEYMFSEATHPTEVMRQLHRQRESGVLCDVTICVGGQEFPSHRNVLAACSPYFLAMFTDGMLECDQDKVTIQDISPSIMQQLIDFAYSSSISITAENAQGLLQAANLIQLSSIQAACCSFLERQMEAGNCLGIHVFAEAYVCHPLAQRAKEFALKNFSDVICHEELKLLSPEKILEFLQSEHLNVDSEECLLEAVLGWAKWDLPSRTPHLPEILQHIHLPMLDPYFLFDIAERERVLFDDPECRHLLDGAKKYVALKDRQVEMAVEQTWQRPPRLPNWMFLTIGGEIYNKNYLTSVDCYDMQAQAWVRLKDLPFPRCHHGAVVSKGRLVYIAEMAQTVKILPEGAKDLGAISIRKTVLPGGFNKDKLVLNNVLRYEPQLDKWIKVSSMNTPRARHAMATLDGYIYAIGGYDGRSRIDTVERYNQDTNSWEFVCNMDLALSRCHATSLNGKLYVAGGTTEPNNQCTDILHSYDPRTDSWQVLAPLPRPRCLGGLVAVKGHVYAVGGTEEMVNACRCLARYDPETNKWVELSEMIEARFDAGVCALESKIFVLSGHDGENSFYHSIEEYDIDSDTWNTVSSTILPYGRCRFGCVALRMTVPSPKT